MATKAESFLSGVNGEYIGHLYAQYLRSPHSVDASWADFFTSLSDDELTVLKDMHGASWTPDENRTESRSFANSHGLVSSETSAVVATSTPTSTDVQQAVRDSIRALMLIRAYRVRGHFKADLDPLGLMQRDDHPELDPAHYGFSPSDYDRPIHLDGVLGMQQATLRQLLQALQEIYCGKIGVEFMHLTSPEEKGWLQARMEEPRNRTEFTVNGRKAILQRLTAAEGFETYLHKKYVGTKRFGLDGGEALIPAIEQMMKRGGQMGLKEIVLGMPHRGRLNVLANVMGKPFSAIFAEFHGLSNIPDDALGSGDVKYHLGTSSDRDFDGNVIHLSLTANPSHLEAVNPVVIGKVRAKQVQREDFEAVEVMPLLLHGDAAFAGQGLVAETLMISELPGYRVGGTMHVVVNNQIGFTTTPMYGRSGPYPTDMAKMLAAPIFHVNGDDPEAVVHVARIATEFRQKFRKDVVIDIFCYRRFGHNEVDEPAFTQPLMYDQIKKQETTRTKYAKRLVAENVLTEGEAQQMTSDFVAEMDAAFEASNAYKHNDQDFLQGVWEGLEIATDGKDAARRGKTAITDKNMQRYGKALTSVPDDFAIHSKLKRLLDTKAAMFKSGENFDWGTAETLAYAALVDEGYPVRLSGQDCGRGTFSHRHAIMYDQKTGGKYLPLEHISPEQAKFEVHDSPLSEAAVLGFEYGYSLAEPKALVLWEAQFGDFANGAQVIIDQFINSGETKWLRMSGLVLLLPHGYEGQGPEHSSARWERFLQLSAEDNWQVVNCTSPANYFHVLRRQLHRNFRKPLVVMTPKSLLRHKQCVSTAEEFTGDSSFHRILWDHGTVENRLAKGKDVKRVILCSGKVYYDLLAKRDEKKIKDIVILRLEQVYPFPEDALAEELAHYPDAEIIWCQEEPENMGCWHFVDRRIEHVLLAMKHKGAQRPRCIARPPAASPATGSLARHQMEQDDLTNRALKT